MRGSAQYSVGEHLHSLTQLLLAGVCGGVSFIGALWLG